MILEEARFFTVEDAREKAQSEPSIINFAIRDFCEEFEASWKSFRYRDDSVVQFVFADTMRYLTVRVSIGAFSFGWSVEWAYVYAKDQMCQFGSNGASFVRDRFYQELERIGIEVIKAQRVDSRIDYQLVPLSAALYDRVIAGLNTLPVMNGREYARGDVLRLVRQSSIMPALMAGTPEPLEYQTVDVTVTSSISDRDLALAYSDAPRCGLVSFDPVKAPKL